MRVYKIIVTFSLFSLISIYTIPELQAWDLPPPPPNVKPHCDNCGGGASKSGAVGNSDESDYTLQPIGPTPEELQHQREEQARSKAAEVALQKARSAMNQGNLSAAIRHLQEALRNQPNNEIIQGQLENIRAMKAANDRRERLERAAAIERGIAAMQAEEARLKAEREAAQVRLDETLNKMGSKIVLGTAFQQLQQAAKQGTIGKMETTDDMSVKALQVPWVNKAPLSLPPPPITLSAPPRFKRPEDSVIYTHLDQVRTRLQVEYNVLEEKLNTTTDPVARAKIKTQVTNKKSEIDTVVVKMLDLSFNPGNQPALGVKKE